MKKLLTAALSCAALLSLSACGEARKIQNSASDETTTAVTQTTAATSATTTTATTAITAPPLSDFTEAEGLTLEADEFSVRDSGGTFKLTNNSGGLRNYRLDYRLIEADSGREVRVVRSVEDEEEQKKKNKTINIAAGETKEINADWSERYGFLKGGDYIYELLISMDQQSGERVVCRAPFTVVEAVFTPVLSIDPETVTPEKLTLTIRNSDDCGRSYGLAYRMIAVAEDGTESILFRVTDMQARVKKNYHVAAGGTLELVLDWREKFGSLLEGKYAIEIELLADGSDTPRTCRAEFEIV